MIHSSMCAVFPHIYIYACRRYNPHFFQKNVSESQGHPLIMDKTSDIGPSGLHARELKVAFRAYILGKQRSRL
jgi:hypothetical protein